MAKCPEPYLELKQVSRRTDHRRAREDFAADQAAVEAYLQGELRELMQIHLLSVSKSVLANVRSKKGRQLEASTVA